MPSTPKMQPFWYFLKPPCPSGEQIANGGFETGSLPPWYITNGLATVISDDKHSGAYAVLVQRGEYSWGMIKQDLPNIPASCIASMDIWVKTSSKTFYPGDKKAAIWSSVGAFEKVFAHGLSVWSHYDLMDVIVLVLGVDPNATINGISIAVEDYLGWVKADDVSLIGKG